MVLVSGVCDETWIDRIVRRQVFLEGLCNSQISSVFRLAQKVGLELFPLTRGEIIMHVIINQIVFYSLCELGVVAVEKEALLDEHLFFQGQFAQ